MSGLAGIGSVATSSQMVCFPTNFIFGNISTQLKPNSGFTFHTPPSLCLNSNMRNSRVVSTFPSDSARSTDTTRDPDAVANPSKLYVSGLSFRTTEEGLRNAFEKFGRLIEVNLVMDRIARRSRGFGFIQYETEEEAKMAIEGMHGKFLDGRVIFVEVAKPPRPRTD